MLLDELTTGALSPEEGLAVRSHVAGCDRCGARLGAIEGDRAAFLEARPPWRRTARPRRRRIAIGGGAFAVAAAAAALLLVSRVEGPSHRGRGARVKGGNRLTFFVKRADMVRAGGPGEVVRPGDVLGFSVTLERAAHVAVLSVDAAGRASVYFPDTPTAAPLDEGRDIPLTTGAILDDILGDETLHALFCDRPVELEPLRAAFESSPRAPPIPDGCQEDRVSITKVKDSGL
jgi:hypothetical protein